MDKIAKLALFSLLLVSLINSSHSGEVYPTCTERFTQPGTCKGLQTQKECFDDSWSRFGYKYGAMAPVTCQCFANDASSHTCQCEYACRGPRTPPSH